MGRTTAPEKPSRLLLQCSIPFTADDWHVGRFSLLVQELSHRAEVTARNLEQDASGNDETLVRLDRSRFDQLWLLVDGGVGLTPEECAAVNRFAASGGGLLTARDHADMGLWLRSIAGVGKAHFFHDASCWEPDPTRRVRDDQETATVDWPNYHSGRNGDTRLQPGCLARRARLRHGARFRCHATRSPAAGRHPTVREELRGMARAGARCRGLRSPFNTGDPVMPCARCYRRLRRRLSGRGGAAARRGRPSPGGRRRFANSYLLETRKASRVSAHRRGWPA